MKSAPADVDAECPTPEGVLDVFPDGGPRRGRMVPTRPQPGQRLAPCPDKKATEINGACYYEANPSLFMPPCESPTFEHSGRCYHMAVIGQRTPTSIQQ